MTSVDSFLIFSVYGPLVGFLLSMLLLKNKVASLSAALCGMSVAFLSTLILCFKTKGSLITTLTLMNWLKVGSLSLNIGIHIDPLVLVMLVVVNTVSLLVHIYSLGYMAHDAAQTRFMGYLSFFTFMMLMLVTAPNMVQLFFGWEGVGLASYLLIGFWYEKRTAGLAANKAFIVNRIGDLGLILAMAFLFLAFGSLDFDVISANIHKPQVALQTVSSLFHLGIYELICLCLILGAAGKSAQFGLHVWLPDAMEGPTPVSALIHAATMVTAGVFLVAKFYYLFELAPFAKEVLTWLGMFTALFAGTVALAQTDIKRIIAYSTCSQLGYMMSACGVGAYKAAIFHLATHAFFKALLFLGAGSVIHAMSDEQNITKMGGIRKAIPLTYLMMWVGTLAIIGAPFFAGFYSKEAILNAIYNQQHLAVYIVGIFVVVLTSYYSLRLMFVVFHGKQRADDYVMAHVHESPLVMLVPLFVLAFGAIFSGYFGNFIFGESADAINWTGILTPKGNEVPHHSLWRELLALSLVTLGAFIAYHRYVKQQTITEPNTPLFIFFTNKWFMDEFYEKNIVNPLHKLASFIANTADPKGIDVAGPHLFAKVSLKLSSYHHKLQTGYVFHYALFIISALVLLIATTWLINK